jgi:hypothetical protein
MFVNFNQGQEHGWVLRACGLVLIGAIRLRLYF